MYFQNLDTTGELSTEPLQIGNILISNYGTSLVAMDLNTKNRLWRIFTKDKNKFIGFDLRLFGIGDQKITSWDLRTGEEIDSALNQVFKGFSVGFFGILPNGNLAVQYQDKENTVLVTYSARLKILASRSIQGNYKFAQKKGEDLFSAWTDGGTLLSSGDWNTVGQEFTILKPNVRVLRGVYYDTKFYLLTRTGFYAEKSWKEWEKPIERIHQSETRYVFQNGTKFYEWQGSANLRELKFAESAQSILPIRNGYLVWREKPSSQKAKPSKIQNSGQAIYYDENGAEVADSEIPSRWNSKNSDILGVTIQGLQRSK
jgi:hypothetical protein